MQTILTEQEIRDRLPVPPYRFKYKITQQSPHIWRVDLIHPSQYSYTNDPVITVWGFIKSNLLVYPPRNSLKPGPVSVCHLFDIPDDLNYTTIIPKTRSLIHHD